MCSNAALKESGPGGRQLDEGRCEWCCRYLISQHPEVERKILAELEGLELLKTPQNPRPREMAYADLSKLTYLNAVIKVLQTLPREFPVFGFPVSSISVEAVVLFKPTSPKCAGTTACSEVLGRSGWNCSASDYLCMKVIGSCVSQICLFNAGGPEDVPASGDWAAARQLQP